MMQSDHGYKDYPEEIDEAIHGIITELSFRRGETISTLADMRNNLYYVISGAARAFYLHGGKEHTYSFAFNGEFITLSHSLLADSNYLTTIEFLESTSIAMIPLDGMQNLLKSFSHKGAEKIMEEILKNLHQHMVHLEDRILMLQTYSAKERYEWIIKRYPQILERANLTQIASYLGMTKETLYRIRSGKYKPT